MMGKKLSQLFLKKASIKLIIIPLLFLSYKVLENSKIETIDYFIRDSLQYLNSTEEIDTSFVTLNLNSLGNDIRYEFIKDIIDEVQKLKPKNILLMMEPLDFEASFDNKKKLLTYLDNQKNLYINKYEARNELVSFAKDELFKNFERVVTFDRCIDSPKDRENRRAFLAFNSLGEVEIFRQLPQLGYTPKSMESITYKFDHWNTQQVLIKSYKLGAFGNFQSDDLLAGRLKPEIFSNKTVIIGINNEFSMLSSKSTFSFFGTRSQKNIQATRIPLQDVFAGILNFHTTGTHIKYLRQFNDLLVTVFAIGLLFFSNLPLIRKLYLYLALIPLILALEIGIYGLGSYYIDISRSLVLLVVTQYFSLPFLFLFYFKKSEERRLEDINNARIDALFTLSSSIAHDLRSPLSTLRLLVSKAKFPTSEQQDLVRTALARLDSMIEGLVKKHSSYTWSNESIDISKIIQQLILEKKTKYPEISFRNTIDMQIFAYADEENLIRVISNILDNSIEAIKIQTKKSIEISYNAEGSWVEISFKDNGPGVPKSVLALIGKEAITTKEKLGGNGLGLLHSTRMIEKMNGRLNIVSLEDGGTVATIKLPNGAN